MKNGKKAAANSPARRVELGQYIGLHRSQRSSVTTAHMTTAQGTGNHRSATRSMLVGGRHRRPRSEAPCFPPPGPNKCVLKWGVAPSAAAVVGDDRVRAPRVFCPLVNALDARFGLSFLLLDKTRLV